MKNRIILGLIAISLAIASCDNDDNTTDPVNEGTAEAAVITGGPFEFDVDGEADMVDGIEITDMGVGESSTWVITDADGTILGLPPALENVMGVNFDEAGPGVCLIWYLNFNGELTGAEMGSNANDIEGDYKLSNSLIVTRNEVTNAGVISGGPYEFTVDGTPDYATDLALDDQFAVGENSTWVITDEDLNILGLPPTLEAAQGVNFDEAGPGICLIWYLRYNGNIMGAEMNANAANLEGDFDLSNPIEVVRNP